VFQATAGPLPPVNPPGFEARGGAAEEQLRFTMSSLSYAFILTEPEFLNSYCRLKS
jgi:hypothetical protein